MTLTLFVNSGVPVDSFCQPKNSGFLGTVTRTGVPTSHGIPAGVFDMAKNLANTEWPAMGL